MAIQPAGEFLVYDSQRLARAGVGLDRIVVLDDPDLADWLGHLSMNAQVILHPSLLFGHPAASGEGDDQGDHERGGAFHAFRVLHAGMIVDP